VSVAGWALWWEAARPRTLPAALAPVAVGSGLAAHAGHFQPAAALLCLGFAGLVQVGTNYVNDYADHRRGADTAERVGPRRAVAAGLISPAAMRRAAFLTFALAFATGLGLVAWGGPWLLAIGVASILSGAAYTSGPYPLAYHGLGDLFVFLFFGLVAVGGTAFVQTGVWGWPAFWAGVPIGLLAANILVVNNYRDVETDAKAGKRTLVVRWGRRAARIQFALSAGVAFAVPVGFWLAGYGAGVLLPCGLAPVAVIHGRRLAGATGPAELIALLGATGRLLAGFGILFAAGLAL
jgi:1,4-dihydroxy-2-naphthoate octaprenyltransferase